MTTITIQLPDEEIDMIKAISTIVKKVKGGYIDIDDDGFTEKEMEAIERGLKEVAMIKRGEIKPLTIDDLWND